MQLFEVGARIDEKADLVWPVAVTPLGSAKQVTEGGARSRQRRLDGVGPPGPPAPGGKRMARKTLTEKTDTK